MTTPSTCLPPILCCLGQHLYGQASAPGFSALLRFSTCLYLTRIVGLRSVMV